MGNTDLPGKAKLPWSMPHGHVVPIAILVSFLGLAVFTVFRLGDSVERDFREFYVSDTRALGEHISSHDMSNPDELARVQEEIDDHCTYDEAILEVEYLHVRPDGRASVLAGNHAQDSGRAALDAENAVIETGQSSFDWQYDGSRNLLVIVVPVFGEHQETIGCLSIGVDGSFDQGDLEIVTYAIGFVLLLAAMVAYYFRQIRRMTVYYDGRKKAEEKLRRLSVAVDQSANMIVITDVDGAIDYVNPRFSELTGYSREEALGQPSSLLKSGEHEKEFYRELWKTIGSGETWAGRVRNRRKNGELYWERKTISPVIDDQGIVRSYLSVGEDITIELHAQQQIIEKDKMSAIGMLAAGVAHEFKNYLGGIMGNASLALEDIDKPDGLEIAREALELVIDLSEKSNNVAMSLLTYSRARSKVVDAEDIRKVIEQALSLVSKEMTSRSIEVATYFEEAPKLRVSASKIQQLLLNLLINAAQAIKEDGVITLALFNAGDNVKIVVGDSGSGIASEKIGRIFDPFYSSKGVWGKDDVVGTGMGLSICRNIAREFNGDLTVESVPGIGTAFTVVLPVDRQIDQKTSRDNLSPQPLRFLIFTLDKTIVSRLHAEASAAGIKLMLVDNITSVPTDLKDAADLVVCDARFPAKGELLHVVDTCETAGVPYATIYGEQLEYQMADLKEQSLMCFGKLPAVQELVAALESVDPDDTESSDTASETDGPTALAPSTPPTA